MQADMQRDRRTYGGNDPLDLWDLAVAYLRCIKKYWILFCVVVVFAAVLFGLLKTRTYTPQFCAKVTYSVQQVADSSGVSYSAKGLSSAMGTIASMAQFKEELREESGVSAGYSLSAEYIEGSNLFTIKVYSDDSENANRLLEALETVYPSWASKLNGTVGLMVIDRTKASDVPLNPFSAVRSYAEGLLIGCVICFALASLYVFTVKIVQSEKDMKKITGKKCIAYIPEVIQKKRSKKPENGKERLLLIHKRIDWGYQQSILTLQARIEKEMVQNGWKVLLLTSTLPQEGKSITTANLALAFAEHGKKVLLIDGDLRNPSVRSIFGETGATKGLVEYFQGDASLADIVNEYSSISVTDAGSKCSKVSEVMKESEMQKLMEECRALYDVILIDTPPSHLFTDAAVLQKYADAVLYVVRKDMVSVKDIEDGMAPFIRTEKLMGYVINRNQEEFSSYGKYGYSRYGHYGKYQKYVRLDKASMNTEETL